MKAKFYVMSLLLAVGILFGNVSTGRAEENPDTTKPEVEFKLIGVNVKDSVSYDNNTMNDLIDCPYSSITKNIFLVDRVEDSISYKFKFTDDNIDPTSIFATTEVGYESIEEELEAPDADGWYTLTATGAGFGKGSYMFTIGAKDMSGNYNHYQVHIYVDVFEYGSQYDYKCAKQHAIEYEKSVKPTVDYSFGELFYDGMTVLVNEDSEFMSDFNAAKDVIIYINDVAIDPKYGTSGDNDVTGYLSMPIQLAKDADKDSIKLTVKRSDGTVLLDKQFSVNIDRTVPDITLKDNAQFKAFKKVKDSGYIYGLLKEDVSYPIKLEFNVTDEDELFMGKAIGDNDGRLIYDYYHVEKAEDGSYFFNITKDMLNTKKMTEFDLYVIDKNGNTSVYSTLIYPYSLKESYYDNSETKEEDDADADNKEASDEKKSDDKNDAAKKTDDKKDMSPQTADSAKVIFYGIIMITSAGALWLAYKKKNYAK